MILPSSGEWTGRPSGESISKDLVWTPLVVIGEIVTEKPFEMAFVEDDDVSVANSYSRGDREFEKATAMLFPSKVAQRGRMRDHTTAPFRRRVTV